jgi:predicted membrane channel-forming protein YqfA (hemolysin III family)
MRRIVVALIKLLSITLGILLIFYAGFFAAILRPSMGELLDSGKDSFYFVSLLFFGGICFISGALIFDEKILENALRFFNREK